MGDRAGRRGPGRREGGAPGGEPAECGVVRGERLRSKGGRLDVRVDGGEGRGGDDDHNQQALAGTCLYRGVHHPRNVADERTTCAHQGIYAVASRAVQPAGACAYGELQGLKNLDCALCAPVLNCALCAYHQEEEIDTLPIYSSTLD